MKFLKYQVIQLDVSYSYDEINKIAITGDGIGSGDRVHMFGSLCASVEVYIDALKKIEKQVQQS